MIPREEFESWLENPITEALIKLLKDEAREYREIVRNGGCTVPDDFNKTGQMYFRYVNTAIVYENLLDNLTYDSLFPTEEDNEITDSRPKGSD